MAKTSELKLPRGACTAIFAGGGAWLPRGSDSALLLADPTRILVAGQPAEVPELVAEIEREQLLGRYVAGYLAYEAGATFGLTVRHGSVAALDPDSLACDAVPLAWMAVYRPESAVIVPAGEWHAFLDQVDVSRAARVLATVKPDLNVSKTEYTAAIGEVRDYIAAGDTYQVNYTVRARYHLGPGLLDPLEYFLALLVRQPVPYAAFLDLGDTQVLSLSPELFLRRDGERLESRPMKGTRPRGTTHAGDVALAYEVAETEKERAENLMIDDMVRNDLGRVCRTGSVHVPTLYAVEPYRTVWQMTSTVQGLLQPGTSLLQIMRAVFPGASITGAPKHHTMEIIADVETEPRGVYTGTVAVFSPEGDFTGNIGIRTILHQNGRCTLGVGSGIVWDATAPAEYEETLAKAAFALAPASGDWRPRRMGDLGGDPDAAAGLQLSGLHLFETLLLETGGRYAYLDQHLGRLTASAEVLGFRFDAAKARRVLDELAASTSGSRIVRLDLAESGDIELSTREAPTAPAGAVTLLVSPFRVDPDDALLRHKTTRRGFYDREHRRAVAEGCFDALFVNRLDKVTEGGITNIFARFGRVWATPPLEDGLLPGTWRAAFMVETGAVERSITLPELLEADETVVGNSTRGAVAVAGLLADPLTY